MKRYIKATTSKPKLDNVTTNWSELEDGSGILFTIYNDDGDVLFENLFEYQDVDTDAIYNSAAELAVIALSQQYDLSAEVIAEIQGEE
jgi:hypothetical protein